MKNFISTFIQHFAFLKDDVPHPARDWLVMLAIALVLLIVSVLYNAWLFSKVVRGEQLGVAASSEVATTTAALSTVRSVLEERATAEAWFRQASFVDPSL